MSLHAGHLLGLQLIKEALSSEAVPAREGSDHGSRAISDNFDDIPKIDPMIPEDYFPEDAQKVGAEAAFATGNGYTETRDELDRIPSRQGDDVDHGAMSSGRAWRGHASDELSDSDAPVIEPIINLGLVR